MRRSLCALTAYVALASSMPLYPSDLAALPWLDSTGANDTQFDRRDSQFDRRDFLTSRPTYTNTKSNTKYRAPPTSTAAPTPTSYPALAALPDNVAAFYQLAAQPSCDVNLDTMSRGFSDNGDGGRAPRYRYCGDQPGKPNVIWWMSNMDVDCDGSSRSGPCGNDPSFFGETAFEYKGKPVDAQSVPFVVINDQAEFRPMKLGMKGLDIVGVVCGGKLTWAVFADTNGAGSMGEASLFLSQRCFGPTINGNNGWSKPNVAYFAFPGQVDPLGGTDFQSLARRGNALLSRLNPVLAAFA